jgi:hypothetical protein
MNLQPWQQKIFDQITLGGIKPKEMVLMTAGRGVGKSAFSAQALKRMMDDINSRPVEDIVLSESKIHGKRIYAARPEGGNWRSMEEWCMKRFGDPGSVWDLKIHRWYMNSRTFFFSNEADRTVFLLKWR